MRAKKYSKKARRIINKITYRLWAAGICGYTPPEHVPDSEWVLEAHKIYDRLAEHPWALKPEPADFRYAGIVVYCEVRMSLFNLWREPESDPVWARIGEGVVSDFLEG